MKDNKPVLLQINITANWGSTGKIAEAIGRTAIAHGWESFIAYGRWCNPSESNLIKIGGRFDKYFHFAEQRICDNEGLCSRLATKRLIQTIAILKPDVVHLHNIHDHYLNYRILFGFLNQTDIKVVWTFHDCWAFTGHCFHFMTKGCMKWKTGCFKCPMKKVSPKTLLDRSKRNYVLKKQLFSNNRNMIIVPCSDWMAGFVSQSFLKNKRIKVIKNGVDLRVFRPVERQGKDDSFGILAVSSIWNRDKGLYDIFRIRELLPSNYSISIVGLSPQQKGIIPSGIIGIERTQNVQELVQLYSSADVLINPTYVDTFPTVNLEALACGTPVITYKTGGSPESVSPGTGAVVEQGDVKGMVAAIKIICSNGKNSYASACRETAKENFDNNKCFEKYMELYEEFD